jgi:hypothetical protein
MGIVVAVACAPARVGQVGEGEAEPPPEYHAHPDVPPDDLTAAAVPDSGASSDDAAQPGDSGGPTKADNEPSPPCVALPAPPPAPPAGPPQIQSGPPVTNHIPAELVMRPIRKRAPCFRRCYEEALQRDPASGGRIAVRFVVDTDGWVRTARVERDDTHDPELAGCIARQFVGLLYPQPDGGRITVVYPIELAPAR